MSDLTTNGVIFQTNSDFDSLIQGCTKWRTCPPQADFDREKKWFQNQAEPGGGGGGGGGGHSVRFHTGVCSSGVRTLTLF